MSLDATRWAWLLNIRPTQKLVLLSLADRADERHMCWPSLRRLTQDTGLDTRTITAALKQLCEEGYLTRTEIPGKGYTYTLIGVSGREDAPRKNVPPAKTYPLQKRTPCKNVPSPPYNFASDPPHFCGAHHNIESKKEPTKNLPTHARAKDAYPEDFKKFWSAYPKKVGKDAALRAWKAASKKTDLSTILAALAWQSVSPQWTRDGPRYIPNPATWLNQGRWADEAESVAPALAKLPEARAFIARYANTEDGGTPAELLRSFCKSHALDYAAYAAAILAPQEETPCHG